MLSASALAKSDQTAAVDETWSLLLHVWQGQPQIQHPQFLLSADHFSAAAEQAKTVALFRQDPYRAFCRFPARLTYLAAQQQLTLPADRWSHCPELQKFLDHVPFSTLELVYASEVLSSASSMLGHIFIKASGQNQRGVEVAHSLAYFTEITTLNPVRLLIESTVTGMPGFFSVRPFQKDLRQYRDVEQRNLWQFQLTASAERRQLLQLHIWELHQIDLTYYFQSFNCATLTLEMLALLAPDLLQQRGNIVSPADVVKAVSQQHLVQSTLIEPAQPWLFYAMADSMPAAVVQQLDQVTSKADLTAAHFALQHPLAGPYTDIRLQRLVAQQQLSVDEARQIRQALPVFAAPQLDLSRYKHPALTPQDSAIALSWQQDEAGNQLLFDWLPAGHWLSGDNRQYLAESELLIGHTRLALAPDRMTLRLQELALYSVRALTPDSQAFPVWSGELYLGYRPVYQPEPGRSSRGEIAAAGGKSYRLHPDVIGYGLAGAGVSSSWRHSQAFLYAKTGLLFELAADSKLQLQYMRHSGQERGASAYQQFEATLSWFGQQDQAVHWQWSRVIGQTRADNQLTLRFVQFY